MIAIVFIIKIEHFLFYLLLRSFIFFHLFSPGCNSVRRLHLFYYIGEGVWNDCDHYDDCYQQNYTSGADLSDVLTAEPLTVLLRVLVTWLADLQTGGP